jgi:nicotinate-nucleotide adenylyltransferase
MFGGSFDPPHLGHQAIIEEAIQKLPIERLLVVPAYLNPFKNSSLASPSLRLEWCHQLFDTLPKVLVQSYEIDEGKSTTTSQSVKHFNQTYSVKYLIIGSDNLESLHQWHEFEWLNETIIWVIATRNSHPITTKGLKAWRILEIDRPISSTQIRETQALHAIDPKIKISVKHILEGQL